MSQISKCPRVTVVLIYWEASGEVSKLRYKSLLYFSSKQTIILYFLIIFLPRLCQMVENQSMQQCTSVFCVILKSTCKKMMYFMLDCGLGLMPRPHSQVANGELPLLDELMTLSATFSGIFQKVLSFYPGEWVNQWSMIQWKNVLMTTYATSCSIFQNV